MCFLEDLTLCEIGGVLGVTESRVCQLRREAVEMLQARRAANDNHEPRVGVRRAACAPRPV
jgi:DNA-directed RNA polymerase sigma subunit (sigma70/sigma32)